MFEREFDDSKGIEKALYAVAIAINNAAIQIKYLGNGDAATSMGAIEALSVQIREGLDGIRDKVNSGQL